MAKIILVILIILAVAGGYFALNKFAGTKPYQTNLQSSPSPTPSITPKTKSFQSKLMKFSIDLPSEFLAQEKLGSVTISADKGEIYIDKNGTNFQDIDSYVNDLSQRNRFSLLERRSLILNGLSAISGKANDEKLYFVYKDNFVYTLSTKTLNLYPDLDQIAKSFRYIP